MNSSTKMLVELLLVAIRSNDSQYWKFLHLQTNTSNVYIIKLFKEKNYKKNLRHFNLNFRIF